MLELIKCIGLKKDFEDQTVLKNINFSIALGEKVGLVGNNGAGKTTLANIICGNIKQDKGSIIWNKENIKIGYLLQSTYYTSNKINNMLNNEEKTKAFFETTSYLGMEKVKSWEEDRFSDLSGGEKTKLALANIWSENPNLLILDEPTNNLDFQGISWLIEEIKKYKGTIIIISHDRYFLDKTVNRILEIEDGIIKNYKGNYSFYRDEKKRLYESQLHEYICTEKAKQKIEKDIKQLKNWSDKAHKGSAKKAIKVGNKFGGKEYFRVKAKKKDKQIKSKLKRLEKMKIEGAKKPEEEQQINFDFICSEKRGKKVIEANNISKAYGDKVLFENSSFYIQRGDRIGLFGVNGCGKTTLIKAIMNEKQLDSGELHVSSSSKISCMYQDVLTFNKYNYILDIFDNDSREKLSNIRILLANLGFNEAMLNNRIENLSLGERTRIKIAKLISDNNNVLVLDEPTNHLDLHSREKLEETLEKYKGTIIIVSHDRYLLERICDKLLVFQDNKINRVESNFKDYLEKEMNNKKDKKQLSANEKLVIDNRIAYIIGELSKYSPEDLEYKKLDLEFKELISRRKS
ncbi:MAG: ABC-F type ribosomal protection protein [Vallitalea sp.]|jgi:macrolide transport system ATP-binding/permease protein|nr:ABC-F type ribosomal protection protein [Vallitalea sp.]